MGTYKKGIKDGAWTEIDYKNGTRRKANYIKGTPEGEQVTYVFPGPMDNNKRLEYINYENGKLGEKWALEKLGSSRGFGERRRIC
jgi:antitoxin component YwqK of YwqJK toxin-antitoxin module